MVKLCKDCKFYAWWPEGSAECLHEKALHDVNLVSGYTSYRTCSYMRLEFGRPGPCGKEAVLFEQKKPWWKLWQRNS
jgi:hypothetical protein